MGCPSKVELNEEGQCVVKSPAYFNVYATEFLKMHPNLNDIGYKRSKEGIKYGIDNRDEIDCGPNVDPEDCDLYTRHIVVPETEYSIIQESRETKYPGAVIVVETATKFDVLKQTVTRFWYDPAHREVKFEELFSLLSEDGQSMMTDILVYDTMAVFIGGGTQLECPQISSLLA